MILAAGLGTRLRPLTDVRPKPLVPVGDRPMLGHVIERVRAAGHEAIVVNAHHHAEAVAKFVREAGAVASIETDLLGTAGGLRHAAALLGDGDVLVHNGDVLVETDLTELIATHVARGSVATFAVVARGAGEGNVGFDGDGRVVRLRKETFTPGETSGGEFTGVHVASARARALMPEKGCVIGDVYIPRLRGKTPEMYVHHAREFVDIGSLVGYMKANLDWLDRQGLASFVGEGAAVSPSVTLDRTIVGAGARVAGTGLLARSVVWPRGEAVAPLDDAVVVAP